MKAKRFVLLAADIFAVFLFIYLLIFPQRAAEPTYFALEFCAKSLIPSLFIYMVLSSIIISLPITEHLSRFISAEALLLLYGTLCGCPVGAKNAVTLFERGRIDKRQAEYLCSFTNNAGVSFVVGFVGKELFGDVRVGIKLVIFQLISSFICALVMKRVLLKQKKPLILFGLNEKRVGLREAVYDSALTMLNLCACVVFFMVAGGVVTRIFCLPPLADAVLKSVTEFSSGCAAAARIGTGAFAVTAFAIGQTGLSVALQVKSVIKSKLSILPFLIGKLLSGLIMTALAIIFG